jgi:hypothetical protein
MPRDVSDLQRGIINFEWGIVNVQWGTNNFGEGSFNLHQGTQNSGEGTNNLHRGTKNSGEGSPDVLRHGSKEGREPPAVTRRPCHSASPRRHAGPGDLVDRTKECAAVRRGEEFERMRYATTYPVLLSPLPCWEELSPELRQRRIMEIVREIDEEAAARLPEKCISPMGPDAVRRQQPHEIPVSTKKSSAPLFLAATKRVRDDLRCAYYSFVAAFREAAARLRAGDRNASFPLGSFPPAMSFRGWLRATALSIHQRL